MTLAGMEEGTKADKRATVAKTVERTRVRLLLTEWRLRELLTLLHYGARQAASLKQRGHGLLLTDMASLNMLVVVPRLWASELADPKMSEQAIRTQVETFALLLSQAATRLVDRWGDDRLRSQHAERQSVGAASVG